MASPREPRTWRPSSPSFHPSVVTFSARSQCAGAEPCRNQAHEAFRLTIWLRHLDEVGGESKIGAPGQKNAMNTAPQPPPASGHDRPRAWLIVSEPPTAPFGQLHTLQVFPDVRLLESLLAAETKGPQ